MKEILNNTEIWADVLAKFTDENLLATVVLCLVLAALAYSLFPHKATGEKIRLTIFVLVAVFFSGMGVSVTGYLKQPTHNIETSPSHSSNSKSNGQNELAREIYVPASSYENGNNVALGPIPNLYGADVLMNAPPYNERPNSAQFAVEAASAGKYNLYVRLAAASPRPLDIKINGKTILKGAINESTGGWLPSNQVWKLAGTVELRRGNNSLELSRSGVFPHITALKLIPK